MLTNSFTVAVKHAQRESQIDHATYYVIKGRTKDYMVVMASLMHCIKTEVVIYCMFTDGKPVPYEGVTC